MHDLPVGFLSQQERREKERKETVKDHLPSTLAVRDRKQPVRAEKSDEGCNRLWKGRGEGKMPITLSSAMARRTM